MAGTPRCYVRTAQRAVPTLKSAFTLIEMLVVIAILGLIAGLAVPALKNLGKSDATISAARQLLDDIGRARQLAIANRTTVYMVFVPTNFWTIPGPFPSSAWWNNLSPAAQMVVTNLCDHQLTGYTFIGSGTVGDQPGRHNWRYLAPWQNLPAGTFIAQQKFGNPYGSSMTPVSVPPDITIQNNPNSPFTIYGFMTNAVPFPLETNSLVSLPSIIFNSFGQLLEQDAKTVRTGHEYIPLAHGSIAPAINGATKTFVIDNTPATSPSVLEVPPGNSTNISANVIDIDPFTGRAVLQFFKMAP